MIDGMQALFPVALPLQKAEEQDVRAYNDGIRYHENNLNQNNIFLQGKIAEMIDQINSLITQVNVLGGP